MTTSFPYFTIARRCGVPYAQVLAQLARWDGSASSYRNLQEIPVRARAQRCNGMDLWPEPADEIKQAICSLMK